MDKPIPEAMVDALYDELFRVGRHLHAPVPIDPKEIIRRHLAAAQQQPDWEAAPPGATHYQPHQDAYYKRVSASEWYVWSRVEDRELLRWLPSPGTSDSAEWVVRPTDAMPPPSAPVGVELAALRVQEWLHREHDILCPVQEIEQAMRTPCSCPFTERALDPPPAAVDETAAIRAFEEHFEASAEDPSFEGELELWLTAWRKALDSAPQQPAAVDEATRLLRAYRGAPKFSNDHNAIKQTCALEDEIDLFLATQQQEKSCN